MKLTVAELASVHAQRLYITEKCDGCGKLLNQSFRYTVAGEPGRSALPRGAQAGATDWPNISTLALSCRSMNIQSCYINKGKRTSDAPRLAERGAP